MFSMVLLKINVINLDDLFTLPENNELQERCHVTAV